jgi:hypothetical protein
MHLTLFTEFFTSLWPSSSPLVTTEFDESIEFAPVSLVDPAFNIDGTPMVGSFDIHGNTYGVTEPIFDESQHTYAAPAEFGGGMLDSCDHFTSCGSDNFGGNSGMDFSSFGWD